MSNLENTANRIKSYLAGQEIDYAKLMLFGSRAGKSFDSASDYDLCLLINREMSFNSKTQLSSEIFRELYRNDALLPMDLIVKGVAEYEVESEIPNTLSWNIKKEGIVL